MKQYRVVYTVNGQGYTKSDPWIYDNAETVQAAIKTITEANNWLSKNYQEFEVWVEEGDLPAWRRVDLD
jgi:hypothetical protein